MQVPASTEDFGVVEVMTDEIVPMHVTYTGGFGSTHPPFSVDGATEITVDVPSVTSWPRAPTLDLMPTSIDFGHRPASTPGPAVPVTITNTSKVTITIGAMTVTPPNYVAVQGDQCSNRNLEPAQSCSLLLTYPAPGAPRGVFQGSLTFLTSIRPPYHARIDLTGSLD